MVAARRRAASLTPLLPFDYHEGFGDASGGEHDADSRVRRIGWSCVVLSPVVQVARVLGELARQPGAGDAVMPTVDHGFHSRKKQ